MVRVTKLYPMLAVREAKTDGSIDERLDVGGWNGVLPEREYFGIGVANQAQPIVDMVE
jgi:hypothetical protein